MIVNILYFVIAVFLALGIAGWLYYIDRKKSQKLPLLLFLLRFLSALSLTLLLFNPVFRRNIVSVQKPKLIVGVDNSLSIKTLNQTESVKKILEVIKNDQQLQEKYQVDWVAFGEKIQSIDSLRFNDATTDISQFLKYTKPLNSFESNTVLLLTDGNATSGNDISYYNGKNKVFPIVFGDTTKYADVSISQINVNEYTFLDNTFPVEIFTQYIGNKAVETQLSVFENNTKVFQKNISFHAQKTSETIQFSLPAKTIGTHYYSVSLSPITQEKNTKNNRSDFTIEVVDQQAKILIVSSFSHPDLGALKQSIEANKQRTVTLKIGNFNSINLSDYQSVILYQPHSEFNPIFQQLHQNHKGYSIITGTKTDWNFLNTVQNDFAKNFTSLKENYRGVYNNNYPNFTLDDFGISDLPPLKDAFGTIKFTTAYETLFFAQVQNTTLNEPLMATYSKNAQNCALVLGEGLWQWRLWSFKIKQSFDPFNEFVNALVQFTANSDTKNRIVTDYEKLIFSNQSQRIKAEYFDQNFKIDSRVSLTLHLFDLQTKKTLQFPMAQHDDYYEVTLNQLASGNYSFKILVNENKVQTNGYFKVLNYSTEEQFVSANYQKLNDLAIATNADISLSKNYQKIIEQLKQQETKNIQKSTKKMSYLIHWKWLLLIIIVSLAVEWLVRKYRGLI